MTKRERAASVAEEVDAKQRKIESSGGKDGCDAEEILKPFMDDLEKIQKALQDLDEQCARKQMEVQKEFDVSKKPILEQRQAVLDKIPGFWATALRNHHMFALLSEEDEPVLKHLKSIELDDNLDDAGSYRIKFVRAAFPEVQLPCLLLVSSLPACMHLSIMTVVFLLPLPFCVFRCSARMRRSTSRLLNW